VPEVLSSTTQSVFAANNGVWYQFSGLGCGNGIRALECRNFFLFTVPFIRGVAYSFGAFISERALSRKIKSDATSPIATSN
jgi:hypothetical protein